MRHLFSKRLRELVVVFLTALLLSIGPNRARAQIPVTDVAGLAQDLQSYLQIVMQYETQLQQYQVQIQQYQNMQQNTARLSNGSWTNIAQTLSSVYSAVQQGQSIANSAAHVESQFSRMFPNYATMLGTPITPQTFQKDYTAWSNNTQQGLQTSISAANSTLNQRATDQMRLASLQAQAGSTDGNLQALQAVGAITSEALVQLQGLRILIAQNAAAQNQYLAQRQAIEDAGVAATQQALAGTSPAFGSGKKY
jgi:type IV secretion system protein TrbJ